MATAVLPEIGFVPPKAVAPRWHTALLNAHGYQGVQACLAIAIYGVPFTLLALWRKSLRPGMIAHAWTDMAGGLLG